MKLLAASLGKGGLPGSAVVKKSTCIIEDPRDTRLIPGSGRFPGGGNGNHSSTLVWKILWTEEPGGHRLRHY